MNLLLPFFIISSLIFANVSIKPTESASVKNTSTSINLTVTPSAKPASPSVNEPTNETRVAVEITNTPSNNSQAESVIYPNSVSTGENVYESTDDPNTITSWYKNIIEEKNMNTTSFVTTNTNDNIKNVLAASNGDQKLYVEIVKNSGSNKTVIKVN